MFYLVAPPILHAYYISTCAGWRTRKKNTKLIDIVINIIYLRPIVEFVKSCQVSIDLEESNMEDPDDETFSLHNNGKYNFSGTDKTYIHFTDKRIKFATSKVTDDFKTESFIIFKVFELSAESMPQIFLQLVILGKLWEKWNLKFQTIAEEDSSAVFCSNQSLFFVSLGISVFQVGVTLQDLMERDVPYGVFPKIISDLMREPNPVKSITLQALTFFYYSLNILTRLSSWVAFCIIFGFMYGFVLVLLLVFMSRVCLVGSFLAKSEDGRSFSIDGMKNFILRKMMDKKREEESNSENCSDTDESSLEDSDEDGEDNMNYIVLKLRSNRTEWNWMYANALFAQTLPWILLSTFVDLPLSMKWLRLYNLDWLGNKSPAVSKEAPNARYSYSKNFFIATNILTTVENILMFCFVVIGTRESNLTCGPTTKERADKLNLIDENCGYPILSNNSIPRECTPVHSSSLVQRHSEALYKYVNRHDNTTAAVIFIISSSFLKLLTAFVFYKVVWSTKEEKKQNRHSGVMLEAQHLARSRSGTSYSFRNKRVSNI